MDSTASVPLTGSLNYVTSTNNSAVPLPSWRWLTSHTDWGTATKIRALQLASTLTQPICKIRENFYTFYILEHICETTPQKVIKAATLVVEMIAYSLIAPFTTPVGMALRGLVANFESVPYVYVKNKAEEKVLPEDKKFTVLTSNICRVDGGYSFTDGGVTPTSDKARLDATIEKIKSLNANVICLYEVPNIWDANYIAGRLPHYSDIITAIGTRAIGPNSMMMVLSSFAIDKKSIKFVPFEPGTELTGRASHSSKGFLSFDIRSEDETVPFATIVSTHLQHSEIPAKPEPDDIKSRAIQMKKIISHIETKVQQDRAVVFTGDLNQDEAELTTFLTENGIDWLQRDDSVLGKPTWGGDTKCATMMKKPPSEPTVLDYTFIAGNATEISTTIIETGFSHEEFKPEIISDHNALLSTITIK